MFFSDLLANHHHHLFQERSPQRKNSVQNTVEHRTSTCVRIAGERSDATYGYMFSCPFGVHSASLRLRFLSCDSIIRWLLLTAVNTRLKSGLTNVCGPVRKKCGAYPQDENERSNGRVPFRFCQPLKIGNARRLDKDILSKVAVVRTFD